MKQLDKTSGRLGAAMVRARHSCKLASDDIAVLLHTTPAMLFEYEQGTSEIPQHILEQIFGFAYQIMIMHKLYGYYKRRDSMFKKYRLAQQSFKPK